MTVSEANAECARLLVCWLLRKRPKYGPSPLEPMIKFIRLYDLMDSAGQRFVLYA